ncbi:hypothetical protein [Rhodococcoides fascians]|uniref:hypothetical protein n=1 Tax=Rhodococcoides fascians TaxID=1828 RepID=UPI00378EC64B
MPVTPVSFDVGPIRRALASTSFLPLPVARAAVTTPVRPETMITAITKIHVDMFGHVSFPAATENRAPNGLTGISSPVSTNTCPSHSEP